MKKGNTVTIEGKERRVVQVITSLTSGEIIGVVVSSPIEVLRVKNGKVEAND